ncbi:hypothetical protein NL676_013280 [Syzygium grande]|nr:hypothetical protein NL676_013280 [Syzygium grande]
MYEAGIDEEESLCILANACRVAEYLEPIIMSQDLLHKFPNNSSFRLRLLAKLDLVSTPPPRSHLPIDFDYFDTPKKLSFRFAPQKTKKTKLIVEIYVWIVEFLFRISNLAFM